MKLRKSLPILGCAAMLMTAAPVYAQEKLTVLLDWFINPDHAPLIVAEQIGAFKDAGLDVEIIQPSDPSMPPRLIAAGQGDIAISYQPQLYMLAQEQLPVKRVATLVDQPLNVLATVEGKGITSLEDLKGKKVGFSVSGVEEATLGGMLSSAGLSLDDVEMVNVNFQLVAGLLTGQVDAVIGGYRNFEATEIREQGATPIIFPVEEHGTPMYDELIVLSAADKSDDPKIKAFVAALKKGTEYLRAHPQETWERFIKDYPDMNTDLYKTAWIDTLPFFANDPGKLDVERYEAYGAFLKEHKLIGEDVNVMDYAVETE
ncbi:ABC transporter substrate-binding protein [Paenirhodobacter populi]|uniref:ABC transporter substrate-binding protein n=1 Tax=Paenirhodobacter populi TaxID=2306993 RepID=UPI000FE40AD9|nr:ABC transporter substrate-binding protein [Sinirhodobacter populi]RWR10298.1 thiamine biosynthesis protein [Sinirhodobacter populi]